MGQLPGGSDTVSVFSVIDIKPPSIVETQYRPRG
jgi:hypothetical protein